MWRKKKNFGPSIWYNCDIELFFKLFCFPELNISARSNNSAAQQVKISN